METQKIFKEKFIEEINKLKSNVENAKDLSSSILSLGKEYLVNYIKSTKIVNHEKLSFRFLN